MSITIELKTKCTRFIRDKKGVIVRTVQRPIAIYLSCDYGSKVKAGAPFRIDAHDEEIVFGMRLSKLDSETKRKGINTANTTHFHLMSPTITRATKTL